MLLHNIFPHVSDSTQSSPLISINIETKVITRGGDKSPVGLVPASDQKLITRAAKMRSDGISPFGRASVFHLKVNLVFVKRPPLVYRNIHWLQLFRIG